VDEPTGWRAYFGTDPRATADDLRTRAAKRCRPETTFRDVKPVAGAGDQPVRRIRTNIGSFHVCRWAFVMTEGWAWAKGAETRIGHWAKAPWGGAARRPSHADKRWAWQRELRGNDIRAARRTGMSEGGIQEVTERLLDLAA
jgi:hypothetical protein